MHSSALPDQVDGGVQLAPGRYLLHRGEIVGIIVRCPFCKKLHTHEAAVDGSFGESARRDARCSRGSYRLQVGRDPRGTNFDTLTW